MILNIHKSLTSWEQVIAFRAFLLLLYAPFIEVNISVLFQFWENQLWAEHLQFEKEVVTGSARGYFQELNVCGFSEDRIIKAITFKNFFTIYGSTKCHIIYLMLLRKGGAP